MLTLRDLINKAAIIKIYRELRDGNMELLEGGTTRSRGKYLVVTPFRKTSHGQMAYDHRGAKLFNALPRELRATQECGKFKRELKRHFAAQHTTN